MPRTILPVRSILFSFVLILTVFFPDVAKGQFQEWRTHTSLRRVVDLAASDDAIWAATEGGLFKYVVGTGEISRFTTTEGLSGLNIRAIEFDPSTNALWVGFNDGVLDRIDIASGAISSFLDIPRASQFPDRDIRQLAITGDTLVVGTGFGIVLFSTNRGEVIETFSRFGADISVGSVTDMTISNLPDGVRRLWVSISSNTANAVVSAPMNQANLQDPLVWTTETVGNGNLSLNSIAAFDGAIYVGTGAGIYVRDDIDNYRLLDVTPGDVGSLVPLPDQLIGIESQRLISIANGVGRIVGSSGLLFLRDMVQGPDGNLWVGDNVEGLTAFAPLSPSESSPTVVRESFFPTGPFDGRFSEITFDSEHNLWLGGVQGSETGFYRFDTEGDWTSYTKRFFSRLQGRPTRFEFIHSDSQLNTWSGSFGGGLARVDADGELTVFDQTNSTLRDVPSINDPNFIIVRGIASEEDGTLWVANLGAIRPLHLRLLDGSWTGFFGALGNSLTYERLFVDNFRQKWIVTASTNNLQRREGLLVLDTGSDITDASDDAFRYFSESGSNGQGLPSPIVNAIAEDKSGRIWVGTDEGLAYFINTGIVARDQNALPLWPIRAFRQQGESQFMLFGLKINAITVDPADNLWVGTDIGAFYITELDGGFDIVTQLTTQNSPLLSNVILSIAVGESTGDVYFATDQGLISVKGDAIAPAEDSQDLFIYPNPVRIADNASPEIIIEGLLDETSVHIMTAAGSLVARLEARGGRVRWDGRDRNNALVPSGMYIVIGLDANGSGSSYGKVAVIR